MSSALVRQALAFVDEEENTSKGKKRLLASGSRQDAGQVFSFSHKRKVKKQKILKEKSKEESTEENIQKLLALSTPTADRTVAEKIVERAVKGKPLLEKIEVKVEAEKSILFPEESFTKFEKSYFCS